MRKIRMKFLGHISTKKGLQNLILTGRLKERRLDSNNLMGLCEYIVEQKMTDDDNVLILCLELQ